MIIPLAEHNVVLSVLGKPQNIKGIDFFPIKILDMETKNLFENIFTFSRSQMFYMNETNILERKIEYHWINVYLSQYQKALNETGFESFIMMQNLLSLICHVDLQDVSIGFKNKDYVYSVDSVLREDVIIQITKYVDINGELKKKFIQFSGEEFDVIRKIIIEQNGKSVSYIDEWNASFEKDVVKHFKSEKPIFTTFSEDIITYKELSKKTDSEFENMTLFQFTTGYNKAKQIKDYEIYYPLVASGKIKFKKELVNYTQSQESGGRYDFLRQSFDEFKKTDLMKNMKL